ncbi:hypothetical protein F4680DRAFT_470138 [Xylaria scruposa]|nr:hypothetical protein F4680DRAFT_470138 [Xylaria scruposa]
MKMYFLINLLIDSTLYLLDLFVSAFDRTQHSLSENWGNSRVPSTLEECCRQNRKLAEIWQLPKDNKVIFIAYDLRTFQSNSSIITDIGLSWWYLHDKLFPASINWHIEDNSASELGSSASDRTRTYNGASQMISRSEIKGTLNAVLKNIAASAQVTCLVGHGIDRTIEIFITVCDLPSSIVILDTEKVWQAQYDDLGPASLEECITSITDGRWQGGDPSDIESSHSYILDLLRVQGARAALIEGRTKSNLKVI